MNAPRPKNEIVAYVAAELEATGETRFIRLAALLKTIKKTGRPQSDGKPNEKLADYWEHMADRVEELHTGSTDPKAHIAAEVQMISEFVLKPCPIKCRREKESSLWDFWDLKGRKEVKTILERRGRIKRRNVVSVADGDG